MKARYLAVMLTIVAVVAEMFLTIPAYAQPSPTVNMYSWTDKPSYDLGEKGVLTIIMRNDRKDQNVILENITVHYPWFAYVGDKWDGNDTIVPSGGPFVLQKGAGNIYKTTVGFSVPTDGRAGGYTSTLQIAVVAAVDGTPSEYTSTPQIYVKGVPLYMAFQDMDKILTLFTVLVVLIIVCTVIIAATVFISNRRPRTA